jgi:hypothetical protein
VKAGLRILLVSCVLMSLPVVSIAAASGAPTRFGVSAPSSTDAGAPFNVNVTVLDASGSPVTDYTGTLHFSSSDGAALLPAAYTFTTSDNGAHLFSLTLNTVGPQTVTVIDVSTAGLSGTANVLVLSPRGGTGCTVNCGPPPPGATPEVDSLVMFGSGLSGLAAYVLRRRRAGRPD